MSDIYLYDDAVARQFEPFALTRPVGELRAGALLIRERWERALAGRVRGHVTSAHLAGFDEPGAAPVVGDSLAPGSWLINARFAPAVAHPVASASALLADGQLVGVRLTDELPVALLAKGALPLETFVSAAQVDVAVVSGWWLAAVWDLIRYLVPMLEHDILVLGAGLEKRLPAGALHGGSEPVFVHPSAHVEPQVFFDTSAGPILVAAEAHVHAFTRLVGPLYIGRATTVAGDRIAASSLGDVCKVHGEMSNCIVTGHANKGHEGFVGHSVLGRWVNLGAGTTTSNLKNTYGTVQLWTPDGIRETGLQFLGTLFGDHAKTGIGVRLTTGTVLGAGANVYGSAMPPKTVEPFAWGEAGGFTTFRAEKFLEVAERMMARRHVTLSDSARAQLLAAHGARWSVA